MPLNYLTLTTRELPGWTFQAIFQVWEYRTAHQADLFWIQFCTAGKITVAVENLSCSYFHSGDWKNKQSKHCRWLAPTYIFPSMSKCWIIFLLSCIHQFSVLFSLEDAELVSAHLLVSACIAETGEQFLHPSYSINPSEDRASLLVVSVL